MAGKLSLNEFPENVCFAVSLHFLASSSPCSIDVALLASKIFTDLSVEEIEKIKNQDINQLKITLANEATSMLHGEKEAKASEETAKKTFSGNSLGDNLPAIQINKQMLDDNINILDLVILSKLEKSKSEIRRLIKGNGIKINSQAISDEKFLITEDLFKDSLIKLSLGKKKHIKVELI